MCIRDRFRGKLDTADQFQARFGGRRQRLVVSLESIVIRYAEDGHPGAMGFRHQLRGRASAVGFVSVRVEIDQRDVYKRQVLRRP